jgi:hypothetical protein
VGFSMLALTSKLRYADGMHEVNDATITYKANRVNVIAQRRQFIEIHAPNEQP